MHTFVAFPSIDLPHLTFLLSPAYTVCLQLTQTWFLKSSFRLMQVSSIVDVTRAVVKLQTPVVECGVSHKSFPEQLCPFCREEKTGLPWPQTLIKNKPSSTV